MASVSVACSAMRPNQMNTRFMALNMVPFLFVPGFCRRFCFEQNLLFQNEFELSVELLFIGRSGHRCAKFLHASEYFRFDVKRNEVNEKTGVHSIRLRFEFRKHGGRVWTGRVL